MTHSEHLIANFYAWELLGRGWYAFDEAVDSEPAFVPFFGHELQTTSSPSIDDGEEPTLLAAAFSWIYQKLNPPSVKVVPSTPSFLCTPYQPADYGKRYTLELVFPKGGKISNSLMAEVIYGLASSSVPLSVEIVGNGTSIAWYCTAPMSHLHWLRDQIQVRFPHVAVVEVHKDVFCDFNPLLSNLCVEYGLSQEFMRPLDTRKSLSQQIMIALESCSEGSLMVFQVIAQGAMNPWAPSIKRSVSDGTGGSFFSDAPEMVGLAREKTLHPLLSVNVRTLVQSTSKDNTVYLASLFHRTLASTHNQTNGLIPLDVTSFTDVIQRTVRRWGMILNALEVVHLIGFPELYAGKHFIGRRMTVPTPHALKGHALILGINEHLGKNDEVSVSINQRLRHTHVIGATGMGKSTLLVQMMIQDMKLRNGLLLLDPHGDVADTLLNHVPQERIKDVIFIDPSNSKHPIGINLFDATTEAQRIVLSSDLLGIFKSFATSWGDTMDAILGNAIDVMLQHKEVKTLIDLRFFLSDPAIRKKTLSGIADPYLLHFWNKEFPLMRKNAVSPLTTRLDTFLRTSVIRSMMSQQSGIDFQEVLQSKKIVVVKLAQGLIGEANSYLLGSLITTKLYQAALGRQGLSHQERHPFFIYIDEFQHFMTLSMESMLSGARKFGLGLILAHQGLDQITDRKIQQSILTNVGIRVCLRVGEGDAAKLEHGFTHFERTGLMNLSVGEAIVRVDRSDDDCLIRTKMLETPLVSFKKEVIACSQTRYGGSSSDEFSMSTSDPVVEDIEGVVEEAPKEDSAPEPEKEATTPDFNQKAEAFKEKESKRVAQREHRRLQELVRKQAHSYHFKAVIEQSVENPKGRVDVALTSDTLTIACEISVTTPPAYELKNIQKCLSNGFQLVCMCSQDARHLATIEKLAKESLTTNELKKVFFGTVQEFLSLLDRLVQKNPPKVERTRGYRVKVNYQNIATGDAQQRMDEIVRALTKARGK